MENQTNIPNNSERTPQDHERKPNGKEEFNLKDELLEWIKVFAVAILITFVLTRFIVPTVVKGPSMEDTFQNNNFLIVYKMAYQWGEPERNDIITFESKLPLDANNNKILIKRVIGLPGDHVQVSGGHVFVNGVQLSEPFVKNLVTQGNLDLIIPEKQYFVMGDNRAVSEDSRYPEVGTIPKEDVIGKVVIRLFPFDKIRLF